MLESVSLQCPSILSERTAHDLFGQAMWTLQRTSRGWKSNEYTNTKQHFHFLMIRSFIEEHSDGHFGWFSPSSRNLSACPFVWNDHRRMTISPSEDFCLIKILWVRCLFDCVTKTHTVAAGLGALSVSTRNRASKGCGLKFFSEQRSGRRRAPPHNPIIHRPRSVKCKPACASPAGQRQAELFICAKGWEVK